MRKFFLLVTPVVALLAVASLGPHRTLAEAGLRLNGTPVRLIRLYNPS